MDERRHQQDAAALPGHRVLKMARCSTLASQRAACVVTIALGAPVVPEVKPIRPHASPGTGRQGGGVGLLVGDVLDGVLAARSRNGVRPAW